MSTIAFAQPSDILLVLTQLPERRMKTVNLLGTLAALCVPKKQIWTANEAPLEVDNGF